MTRAARDAAPVVLLTGFEPFAGDVVNASWEAVACLRDRPPVGVELHAVRLPVAFGASGLAVREAIARVRPELVVATGLDAGADAIRLERLAVNLDDARIPDNDGAQPVDEAAVPGAPLARLATLPVKACLAALRAANIPARLSMSAGGFVCNHVFVHVLDAIEGTPARGGFVHVPPAATMPTARVADALELVVSAALSEIGDRREPGGALA